MCSSTVHPYTLNYSAGFRVENVNHDAALASANDCENILKTYANKNTRESQDGGGEGPSTFAKWIKAGEEAASAARVAKKVHVPTCARNSFKYSLETWVHESTEHCRELRNGNPVGWSDASYMLRVVMKWLLRQLDKL